MANHNFTPGNTDLPNHVKDAFPALLRAIRYADQLGTDPWEFAVEISQLTALGLTPNDFRWLVRSGMVMHRREVTLAGENGRQFQAAGDLTYCQHSCFVLTKSGVELALQIQQEAGVLTIVDSDQNTPLASRHRVQEVSRNGCVKNDAEINPCVPTWDSERRELRFDRAIVKHFKWIAINQQAVLGAFEDDGWPPRIDDPLPPRDDQDPKRRLADTIKCLNRKQRHAVLHFRGDGTGEGVIWELVEPSEPAQ